MFLIGKMINWNKWSFLFFQLSFLNGVLAEDFNQTLMGQTIESDVEKIHKEVSKKSVFIPGEVNDLEVPKTEKKSPFMSNYGEQLLEGKLDKNAPNVGVTAPGTYDNASNYLEHNMKIVAHDIEMKGKQSLALNYYKDTFEYTTKNDVFDKVYREGDKSHSTGILQIAYDSFFIKKEYLDAFWGANIGFGYNQGRGVFIYSREVSDTTFHLVTLPADITFGFGLRPGKWLKFNFEGGPSMMGLYQSRSDRDTGERGKRRRQIGFGYFGQSAFKISLSNLFPKYYYSLYYGMNLTKVWLSILARYQNYSNFQDEIQISGLSLGIGFSFESF